MPCAHLIAQVDLAVHRLFYLDFILPYRHFDFAVPSLICEARKVKNKSKPTVLFVDDEPCMRELMAMILTEEGYEVFTEKDGFDALAHLRSSVPDLIISDLQMPRMSGIEFLSVVRHRFPAIPVIAISGASDMQRVLAGASDGRCVLPKIAMQPR